MSRLIQNIQDSKTRALMRGLLDRGDKAGDRSATLTRMLATVQKGDLAAVDGLLRENHLFRHIETLPEFPESTPFQGKRGISPIPAGPLALDYVALRIAANEARICEAFNSLRSLNVAIQAGFDELISLALNQLVALSGHSLTAARKAAFVLGYALKDSTAYQACTTLVNAYGVNSRNYGMMVTIDAIGAEFSYLDLKYRFRNFATIERSAHISSKISYLCFTPLATTEDDLVALISASYEISLLDAAIALLSHQDQGITKVVLPEAVLSAWRALTDKPPGAFDYFNKSDAFLDLWAFRAAPAFIEYSVFRRIRYALQPLFDLPGCRTMSTSARQFAAEFFAGIEQVADVVPPATHPVVAIPEKFDSATAGTLSRSCALVWVCEKDPDFSTISTEDMALLMGQTFEIDRLVDTELLRRAVRSAANPFVKLVLQTLLRAHSSATLDNFNFKNQFQQYVRKNHDGNILDFMEHVRSLDSKIIHYFVGLLDETMLSQMAFLMHSSEAIYETRASLLEWFADATNDPVARDKAKQLRLDRKIATVRGAINETRLNIDSVRFRQWIEQNKLSDFSDFIRQAQPDLPAITDLIDNSKKSTQFLAVHREPTKMALLALVECYDEFCRNADYGIASFLGRRIRHGTLRGTLLNGLPDPGSVEVPQPTLVQYQSWLNEFSQSIDALAARLYFRGRTAHRDGLLSAEIDSEPKWQLSLVSLSQIFTRAQQDHGVMFVPYLIEQFCWLVFEIELAKIQTPISEARSKWGTLKLRYPNTDEISAAFEKSTNITLGDQFATVLSWFRKPPNISPVAELAHVIQVVFDEARDEYASFTPEVAFTGDTELELSGATYYVVYDALTIAVRNAAKHGIHPGSVGITATVREVGGAKDTGAGKVLEISVSSSLKDNDDVDSALARIGNAGRAGATDADIVEGLSGIRKLKKMEQERSILSFALSGLTECTDRLVMTIVIPFKGLVE